MATTTKSRSNNRSTTASSRARKSRASTSKSGTSQASNNRPSSGQTSASRDQSAFSWGDHAGPLVGAAIAGAAIGFAANFGRKFLMQSASGFAGDWDQVLAAEHRMTLDIFDKMLATDQTQTFKRSMLLMKLRHALDKHAHEEEMVVYPALREANEEHDADALEGEHGYVKTYLYELSQMAADAPNWLETVRKFRDLVQEHARMEENEVFPAFKQSLTDEQNDKITAKVNKDGFWMA